jgi:hypothetical protein
MKRKFATWLCEPLLAELAEARRRIDELEEFCVHLKSGVLDEHKQTLQLLATELNDLRNSLRAPEPTPINTPVRRVARTWSEFRHAVEGRRERTS